MHHSTNSSLDQLVMDPFTDPDAARALRGLLARAEQDPLGMAGGEWASCDTCCDPGTDDYPAPGPELSAIPSNVVR